MILAIESATPHGSVALVDRGAVLRETVLLPGRQASETILSAVSGLFSPGDPSPRFVTCLAVSAGPGSFTGLRVGMAVAKGLCYGWGVPVVRVPTLAALASRFPGEGRTVCPVLDARKKEVYTAFFRWDGGILSRRTPDMALSPDALPGRLPEGEIVFCGDGVGPFGAMFRMRLGSRALLASGPEGLPRAGAVGVLGEAAFREGAAENPRTAIPWYIRPSEAEAFRAGGGPGSR
ncbi:MAG TPA: tRNA (adenosine(37)-N6)-threonylcarbamoyltransferase complex dimerization subunit type 1 TsaB [Candidatus Deferrimicrobiaceae bacterium]